MRTLPQPSRPMVQAVEAAPSAEPPPFKYVGRVARGSEAYAVLARDERVFTVQSGDTVDRRYRVQSVAPAQVVVVNLGSGATHLLPFSSAAAAHAGLPGATAGATHNIDDVSLQLAGPREVAIGEQFTLTVSLDSGAHSLLDTGRVEVRFDPKVLAIAGQPQSSGAARVDIGGAYVGHPAPATLQLQVIAKAPTATEIRVVPTNIADNEGRSVSVNTPQPHRLSIVRAAIVAPPEEGDSTH